MSPVVTTCSASSLHQQEFMHFCCWVLHALGNYMLKLGVTSSTIQLPAWCSTWGLARALCGCFQRRCSYPGPVVPSVAASEALQPLGAPPGILPAICSMAGHTRLPLSAALGKGAVLTCGPPPSGACRQLPCALALGRPASWCRWRESAGRSAKERPWGSCAYSAAEQRPAGCRQCRPLRDAVSLATETSALQKPSEEGAAASKQPLLPESSGLQGTQCTRASLRGVHQPGRSR